MKLIIFCIVFQLLALSASGTPISTHQKKPKAHSTMHHLAAKKPTFDKEDALVDAAAWGNVQKTRALLNLGANPNTVVESTPAQVWSSSTGSNKVRLTPTVGVPVISFAASNGRTKVVQLLLDRGAQVDMRDDHGMTALMIASQNGHDETVRLLLSRGADANAVDDDGQTALLFAARNGVLEVTQDLLNGGANINWKSRDGKSALMIAEKYEWKAMIAILQKAINKEAKLKQ